MVADSGSVAPGRSGPGLTTRERRLVSVACLGPVDELDAQVFAALERADLDVAELNEVTLHVAVYAGWPAGAQLEMSVRSAWHRLHEERGEQTPPWPAQTVEDLGISDPEQRIEQGVRLFEEINLIDAPAADSPYFHAGILSFVFGHVWARPGLSRRERRLVTLPCVGRSGVTAAIWAHTRSALHAGDLTRTEVAEVAHHLGVHAGPSTEKVLLEIMDDIPEAGR